MKFHGSFGVDEFAEPIEHPLRWRANDRWRRGHVCDDTPAANPGLFSERNSERLIDEPTNRRTDEPTNRVQREGTRLDGCWMGHKQLEPHRESCSGLVVCKWNIPGANERGVIKTGSISSRIRRSGRPRYVRGSAASRSLCLRAFWTRLQSHPNERRAARKSVPVLVPGMRSPARLNHRIAPAPHF